MNEEPIQKLSQRLLGTCDSISIALENIDEDAEDYDICDVENDLLDYQVERCQGCGWWFECCELVSEDYDECGKCEDCRK